MKGKTSRKILLSLLILIAVAAGPIQPSRAADNKFADPGKGYDYVFFGYAPAMGAGGPGNRAMLLLDIDDAKSPRPNPDGAQFKLLVENARFSGRLDVKSQVEPATPIAPDYFRLSGTVINPQRVLFTYRGPAEQGNVSIQGDALLEANNLHYLRAVIDVVHNGIRTRYLVNCEPFNCDVP